MSLLVIKKIDAACVDERGAKKEATAPASMLAPLFIKIELSLHLCVTILMLHALTKEVERKKRPHKQHLCLLKRRIFFAPLSVSSLVIKKIDAACFDERGAKKEAIAPSSMLAPLFIKKQLSLHLCVRSDEGEPSFGLCT